MFSSDSIESKFNFFNFDEQRSDFNRALREGTRLILINGARRTGKTTLLRLGLEESGRPYLLIDARSLTAGLTISRRDR